MSGMSLRDLAQKVEVSATAISKYERGLNVPSSGVIIKLAKALDVRPEYFFRPNKISLTDPVYRSRASLPERHKRAIQERVKDFVERYMDVEYLLGEVIRFDLPDNINNINRSVSSLDHVEDVAFGLRQAWNLGQGPIESLTEVLEEKGIKVGMIEGYEKFDALTCWANNEIPIIVIKKDIPGDRQRFNLAHELGHIVLKCAREVDPEKAAYRFAGAFLAPDSAVRFELGQRRRRLDLYELHLLKHKYGLSMQGWIYRAMDLGIISASVAKSLFRVFRERGWHSREPGDQFPSEEPGRMKRLVLHALAEGIISEARASELLAMPLEEFKEKEAKEHEGFPVGIHS
jgi:Zn-dependent peptidase ImmA (M78 family)/DNA-binding XRE family transcriptional regulator